jgi:hypothetical protein
MGIGIEACRQEAAPNAMVCANAAVDFCIFSSPGAGGSLLVEELDAQPDVVCHGEVFHHKRLPLAMNLKLLLQRDYDSKRQHDPDGFLADLRRVSRSVHPQMRLMGFKVSPPNGDRLWRRCAAAVALRKILVQRPNKLAQYADALRGQGRASGATAGTIHLGGGKEVQRPHFDAQAFERWLVQLQGHEAALIGDGSTTSHLIIVTHEELLRGDSKRERLLHIGATAVDTQTAKTAMAMAIARAPRPPTEVAERFADPQAVEMALRERGSEHWLHEA